MVSHSRGGRKLLTVSALLGCAAMQPAVASAQQEPGMPQADEGGAAAAGGSDAGGLGDIVVTARRRDEALQDVPIAVTALGGEELANRSAKDVRDLSSIAPNLLVTGSNYGSTYAVVNLRGQDNANIRGSYDPAVGIYFDEVYLGRSSGALMSSLVDMQSVQVLRGPQGTLFGRNNTGGAVLLTPNRPELTRISGNASILYGNYDRFELAGVLNVPIVEDRLGIRASYSRVRQDGTQRSVTTGIDDYGNRHRDAGRVSVRWKPSEAAVFDFTYDVSRVDEAGTIDVSLLQPGPDFYSTMSGMPAPRAYAKVEGFTLRSEVEIASDTSLKAIGSRRTLRVVNDTDVDGTPSGAVDQHSFARQNQWTGELQINGTVLRDAASWLTALDYTVGVFYFWEESFDGSQVPYGTVMYETGNTQTTRNVNRSTAGYVQIETNHFDRLFLTAGARRTTDHRSLTLRNVRGGVCGLAALPVGTPVDVCYQSGDVKYSFWSWALGARYQFTPAINAYVKWDKSQRSGGLGSSPLEIVPFRPEVVTNIEAGLKTELLDRRLRINLAAFRAKYDDIQRSSRLPGPNDVPYNNVFNAAAGRIQGVEAEVNAAPVRGLTLGGTLGYLDAKYTEFIDPRPGPTNGSDLTYLDFASTPKFSYSVFGAYEADLGTAGSLLFRMDYSHRSRVNFDVYNDPAAYQRGVGLLNGRVAYSLPAGMLGQQAEIALYGRNLTNRKYNEFALAILSTVQRNDSPRSYGVEFKVAF